jgi:hypothetical protein
MGEKVIRFDPTRPEDWLAIHRGHGGRPYRDAKIGMWHTWRCPACGDRFRFTDDDREREPGKFVLE